MSGDPLLRCDLSASLEPSCALGPHAVREWEGAAAACDPRGCVPRGCDPRGCIPELGAVVLTDALLGWGLPCAPGVESLSRMCVGSYQVLFCVC